MNYAQAVAHLNGLGPELASPGTGSDARRTRKFDLDHMRVLCQALGDPQLRVPSILIAGTNGKGSTAATLASILSNAGYATGLYTSPHLIRVNERIQLGQPVLPSEYGNALVPGSEGPLALSPISDNDYARLYTRVDDVCEQLVTAGELPHHPSFFERLTALAFLYFAGDGLPANRPLADIMVLEVGLGGRLDATNIVDPLLSVITDIALDHQDYLGDTIAQITGEKCGILRQNGTLVTLPQLAEANQAIGVRAAELNVRGVSAADYIPAASRPGEASRAAAAPVARNQYTIYVGDQVEPGELRVDSPLAGAHQERNLALAIASAIELRNLPAREPGASGNRKRYNIDNAAIEAGIHATEWPGRLETIAPNLLLDVAHNPAGAWTLRAAIAALPEDLPRTLIFSCLRDKDLGEMSRILFPLFDASAAGDPARRRDHLVLAPIPNPRASSLDSLIEAAVRLDVPVTVAPNLEDALAQARALTPSGGWIVATGSVYLVGELRRLALALPDPLAEAVGS